MAVLNASPSTLQAVEAQAQQGDVIALLAGTYATRPSRSGVTYQAVDWEPGRVLRGTTGHLGQGMAVRFTGAWNFSDPGVRVRGVFHDTRGLGSINAGVFSASGVVLEDCASAARRSDGGRQIGYTLGTGAIRVSGVQFIRHRHHPTGQPNNTLDHAFYLKNCTDCLFQEVLVYDGGRFPFHLYTNADLNKFERCVVWGSGGCVTFSGASDSTTGTSVYGTSDNNLIVGCILGANRLGSCVESWTSDASRPVAGNVVRDTLIFPGSGRSAFDGKPWVQVIGAVNRNPGFRDPVNGDFTRTGEYDGFGPPQLFGTATPPPPPPPPSEDPRVAAVRGDLQSAKQKLAELSALVDSALSRVS